MSAAAELRGDIVDQSLKAYYREFRRAVEASDVVLEVLDARDPLSCRCPQVEEAVLMSGTNKKLILVLNKIGMSELTSPSSSPHCFFACRSFLPPNLHPLC